MLEQKLTIFLECCAQCHEHEHLGHTEFAFQSNLRQLSIELCRSWKSTQILVNKRKQQPQIGSFQITFDGILLYSKLFHESFPKPYDIAAILHSLTKLSDLERQFLKMRMETRDLYEQLRQKNKSIRLSLKQVHQQVKQIINGNQENYRPKSHVCRNSRKSNAGRKNKMDLNSDILENSDQLLDRRKSQAKANMMMTNNFSIKSSRRQIKGSENQTIKKNPQRLKLVPTTTPSCRKLKKYTFLSKQIDDITTTNPKFKGEIVLMDLSSNQQESDSKIAKMKLTKFDLMERRKKQGFSTSLKSKEIEEQSRKYSFLVKKFTQDIDQNIRNEVSMIRKSQFANIEASSDENSGSNIASYQEESDGIESQFELGQKHMQKYLKKSSQSKPKCSSKNSSNHKQHPFPIIQQGEHIVSCLTADFVQNNSDALKLIQHFCKENQHVRDKILNERDANSIAVETTIKQYKVNIFNIKKGIFVEQKVKIMRSSSKVNQKFQNWTHLIFAAVFPQEKTYNIDRIIKIMTGFPMINIKISDVKRVKKIIFQSYFDREQKIGQVFCLPSQGSIRPLISYSNPNEDLRNIKLTYLNEIDQRIEASYDLLSTFFDSFMILFNDPRYFFCQLESSYKCQEKQFANPSWKILFENPKKCSLFVEFTDCRDDKKPTNLLITKLLGEKGDTKSKRMNEELKRSRVLSRKNMKNLEIVGQINRRGTFFFELELEAGTFCCEVTKQFSREGLNSILFYSSSQIKIIKQALDFEQIETFCLPPSPMPVCSNRQIDSQIHISFDSGICSNNFTQRTQKMEQFSQKQ